MSLSIITASISSIAVAVFFVGATILIILLYRLLIQHYHGEPEPEERTKKGSNMKYYQAALGQYMLASCMAYDIEEAIEKLTKLTGIDTFTVYENGKTMVNVDKGNALFDEYIA